MSGQTGFVRRSSRTKNVSTCRRKVDMQCQPFVKGEFAWADVPKEKGDNL